MCASCGNTALFGGAEFRSEARNLASGKVEKINEAL